MSTDVTALPALPPVDLDGPAPGFTALLAAEWTKLRSVRSTLWSLLALVAVALGLSALATGVMSGQWSTMSPADRAHLLADPIGLILQPAASFGQVAACVLGVMVIASEFSTGTIRPSVLAVPTRTPFLVAKAIVLALVLFVVAELAAVPAVLLGGSALSAHVTVGLGDPVVLRATVGFGLYIALTGLLSMAIGAMLRHVGGAITTSLAMVIVVPTAVSFVPGRAGEYLSTYLPGGGAGQAVMSSGQDTTALLSPGAGFAVALVWTALALAVAAALLRRREVTGS